MQHEQPPCGRSKTQRHDMEAGDTLDRVQPVAVAEALFR